MPGGRPRKPTALHRIHGTDRPDRMNPHEPAPPLAVTERCPSWLRGRARSAWKWVYPRLRDMRVLTEADRDALALLCDAYGELIECRAVIAKFGRVYESKIIRADTKRVTTKSRRDDPFEVPDDYDPTALSVMIRPRPEVAIAADAWRRVNAMMQQFGLTPASRSKVSAQETSEVDPFDALLRGSV